MNKVETQINGMTFSLETGRLARQASGSVLASVGETVVLVTVVSSPDIKEGVDFLPLLVDYQEMFYAAGRIPGGYFRREVGRPSEKETLTSRLIDRPLRPRFPKGYRYDTQIIATVLSADPEVDPDVIAITGASAALCVSDVPFDGPIAGVRVGRVNGSFVVNPTKTQLAASDLNLIVAGSKDAVVMVEGGANILPEQVVLDAIFFGHAALQPLIEQQEELMRLAGRPKRAITSVDIDPLLAKRVRELATDGLRAALSKVAKVERSEAVRGVVKAALEAVTMERPGSEQEASEVLKELEKEIMRGMIVDGRRRIDGRAFDEVRPITCSVGDLPRTHGSAVFTRGETQALVVATLGSSEDEQRIESLGGEILKNFMLHYNFPPYCVGEVRPLRGPARRDIGHGALAERGLLSVMPSPDVFPYTIRVVSNVLESNGSSSMATVCGATLAMMDAGIPIKEMVAGVAMGLIKEGDDFIILSDILGDEDHLGDMDFKVVGTKDGVTALQMDIKISGITKEVLEKALDQAKESRGFILGEMRKVMDRPREELCFYAPRITTLQINPDRIKDLIGPGGKNIRGITSACGVKIDVDDSGRVNIFASSGDAAEKAVSMIKGLTREAEVGEIYEGTVKKIVEFGAFVEIFPGTDGLLHISQIENRRINDVHEVLNEGDRVLVKVLEIDKQGKIRLSRKAVLNNGQERAGAIK
ncbi:polyribonucleotide nucleotidyltransferase [Dissulfurimicrobium hydrothermale]|uniref:polyribonucleotide nucleotidyltransferase n=1 Tax=Dissulfurimicrobium hydrothermale TaxID=1750598 RepID=UPI001EDB2AB1|nr:polyribonucleotide nucleotidyltransferase [Dissulfurimicrobium hydrothermale]UKL14020.1 polyribonucleotide nucleotidyltransferase [Dissulfurimicrobium hydrothermale]